MIEGNQNYDKHNRFDYVYDYQRVTDSLLDQGFYLLKFNFQFRVQSII